MSILSLLKKISIESIVKGTSAVFLLIVAAVFIKALPIEVRAFDCVLVIESNLSPRQGGKFGIIPLGPVRIVRGKPSDFDNFDKSSMQSTIDGLEKERDGDKSSIENLAAINANLQQNRVVNDKKILELSEKITLLDGKSVDLNAEIALLKEGQQDSLIKLATAQHQIVDLEHVSQVKEDSVVNLNEEKAALQKRNADVNRELSQWKERQHDYEQKLVLAQQKLNDDESKISKLNQSIEQLQETNGGLDSKVGQLTVDYQLVSIKLQQTEQERDDLKKGAVTGDGQPIQVSSSNPVRIGVQVTDLNPTIVHRVGFQVARGAFVIEVNPKGPAMSAGVHIGDVIIAIGSTEITDASGVVKAIQATTVGKSVHVIILRSGQRMTLSMKVAGAWLQQLSPSKAGLSDRIYWENLILNQRGDRADGMVYWANQRNNHTLQDLPSCADGQASESSEFVEGCEFARSYLTAVDSRRESEPDYKTGWNSYGDVAVASR